MITTLISSLFTTRRAGLEPATFGLEILSIGILWLLRAFICPDRPLFVANSVRTAYATPGDEGNAN